MAGSSPLKILHVLRAPVGGLFRHVLDLAQGQAARGHNVGIVAAATDNAVANEKLTKLAPTLSLGVSRIPMQRQLGLGDLAAVRHVARCIVATSPDVVHGHGAKGGAFARLASNGRRIRVYTPHGGSLHYGSLTPQGLIYGMAERALMRRTELFLFESAFAREAFIAKIGTPRAPVQVVHNGVSADEFRPVEPAASASDIVTVGELRHIKGIDVLIDAVALLAARGRALTAAIVGAGPDERALRALVEQRGLSAAVQFAGYQPARHAFAMGRLMIVASRAESLPYIVLEAAAAGLPMIATAVGGIPEVFGPDHRLVAPGDPQALAQAMAAALDDPAAAQASAGRLRERVKAQFSQDSMVDGVLTAYGIAISAKFQRSH